MKKGIEVTPEYDKLGRWHLVVRKAKGQLTLEDIKEAAEEYEQDYYALILKCIDADTEQYFDDDLIPDSVELYPVSEVLEAWERLEKK